jgi:ParB family chromosome partitioning protein
MKIATFNANSIRARRSVVIRWLEEHQPDVPCLQQTKIQDVDGFLPQPLRAAIDVRRERTRTILELDDAMIQHVEALKARGLTSPYLKSVVVARLNPLRFRPKDAAPLSFDEALARMTKAAARFNPDKITAADLTRTGGPPEEIE